MYPKKPVRVILDSSFLFVPSQFNIDIFEELAKVLNRKYDPLVLSSTLEELHKIASGGSVKIRRQASFALKFAEKSKLITLKKGEGESYDDVVVRAALEMGCSVATNDRELRRKLRQIKVPVIYLRQKTHLTIDGAI